MNSYLSIFFQNLPNNVELITVFCLSFHKVKIKYYSFFILWYLVYILKLPLKIIFCINVLYLMLIANLKYLFYLRKILMASPKLQELPVIYLYNRTTCI